MSTQSEILRAASLMVDAYVEMDLVSAFIRADELSARGDEPEHLPPGCKKLQRCNTCNGMMQNLASATRCKPGVPG